MVALYAFFRSLRRCHSGSSSTLKLEAGGLVERLRVLGRSGRLQEAAFLFYSAPVELQSQQAYAALFQACAGHGDLHHGFQLHHHMLSHPYSYSRNLYLANHLIDMYAKCGNTAYARQVFDEMSERNVVSWTALITGYARASCEQECFCLLSAMLAHCRPNEFAFSSVLSSSSYESGKQVHGLSLKMGLHSSVYVANALISMYGRCHDGAADEAWTVFEAMESKNLVSWNSMIAAFQCCSLGKQAINLFVRMHRDGIGFDRATLLNICSSLYRGVGLDADLGLKFCLQLHSLSVKSGFIIQTEVATALVKAYSELGGNFSGCYKLFMEMSHCRDIVAWTGIISTCAEHDPERAILLYHQLRQEDLDPDWYTFSIVLKACAGLVTARHALMIHAQLMKAGFENDTVLNNALIHGYSRCGSIDLSKRVFKEMGSRDLVSWNSILKAYALHGQAEEALLFFAQMDVKPNAATFVALLSACSHTGLVEEGMRIFKSMSKDHGTFPQLDHYTCVIDMLGRAGRLVEAEEVIGKMPMEPDSVIWSALLGSCRKHGNTRLAELAAERLKELEPRNSSSYVQMSNVYSAGGSYNEAGKSRKAMTIRRVRKEPGLSWTEVGNQIHEFASGGRRRPEREVISKELEKLMGRLKEIGYVPETKSALQDTEEEQKEEQLLHHSEKLALVFATMQGRRPGGGSAGNSIQIVKNIRICVDCHNFMKLASQLLGREIVVRDSNRFHHFKDSSCSCNDYW